MAEVLVAITVQVKIMEEVVQEELQTIVQALKITVVAVVDQINHSHRIKVN